MTVKNKSQKIKELLTRGVRKTVKEESLVKKLNSGKN